MVKVIPVTEETKYTDLVHSKTRQNLFAEWIVEITEYCPGLTVRELCLLSYTREDDRQLVQIRRTYRDKPYMGTAIHFFMQDLLEQESDRLCENKFGWWATEVLGVSTQELSSLVKTHAPASSTTRQ